MNTERAAFGTLVQILTGHNFLKRHNALVDHTDDAECRLCLEEEETTFHVVAECDALVSARTNAFSERYLNLPLQWSTHQLASFLREAQIGQLLDPEV